MTDISKVTFNSNEYDIKDAVARNQMVQLTAAEYEEIPDSVKNSDNKLYLVEDEAYTYPIDAAPTANSDHLVASGGVYTALAEANAKIDDNTDDISANTTEINALKNGLSELYPLTLQNETVLATYTLSDTTQHSFNLTATHTGWVVLRFTSKTSSLDLTTLIRGTTIARAGCFARNTYPPYWGNEPIMSLPIKQGETISGIYLKNSGSDEATLVVVNVY